MYNPYLNTTKQMLEPVNGTRDITGGILRKLHQLDSDDILIMLIVYLVMRDGKKDDIWPLLAALMYCFLS